MPITLLVALLLLCVQLGCLIVQLNTGRDTFDVLGGFSIWGGIFVIYFANVHKFL